MAGVAQGACDRGRKEPWGVTVTELKKLLSSLRSVEVGRCGSGAQIHSTCSMWIGFGALFLKECGPSPIPTAAPSYWPRYARVSRIEHLLFGGVHSSSLSFLRWRMSMDFVAMTKITSATLSRLRKMGWGMMSSSSLPILPQ